MSCKDQGPHKPYFERISTTSKQITQTDDGGKSCAPYKIDKNVKKLVLYLQAETSIIWKN